MLSFRKSSALTRAVFSQSSFSAADFLSSQQPQQTSAPGAIKPSRRHSGKRYNVPPSAEFVARVSGIPTMAKLPHQETADGLDAAFVGVPVDTGTSNRPGARWAGSLPVDPSVVPHLQWFYVLGHFLQL